MEIQMRRMTEADRPHVYRMMKDFFSSDAVLTNGSDEIIERDIDECLSDSPFLEGFVFTDESGEVKGYAMAAHSYSTEFGRHCVWVEDLYLESELRGRGVATEFLEYLRTAYPDSVTRLESETDNDRAIRTYLKNGFEEIPYLEMIRR
jgi:GNAT superfamily N-acetyltransferase